MTIPPTYARKSARVESAGLMLLLLGAACPWYLNSSLGRIYPIEFVFLAIAVHYTLIRTPTAIGRLAITTCAGLWLLGQVLSDAFAQTALSVSIGSLVAIAFFATDILALQSLLPALKQVRTFATGLAVGQVAATLIEPNPDFHLDPWKFGLATPTAILLIALPPWGRYGFKEMAAACASIIFALSNLLLDFRSMAALSAMTAVILFISRRRSGSRVHLGRIVVAACAIACCLVGLSATYSSLAINRHLSTHAETRFKTQSSGSFGLVLGARPELVGMAVSISDSPVFGAGSAASLSPNQYRETISILEVHGYQMLAQQRHYLARAPYPLHSALFGSWFAAGILCLPFWLLIIHSVLVSVWSCSANRRFPAAVAVGAWTVMSILFSPLGADQRTLLALGIAASVALARTGPES